jgi:CheY-like chemotaxis protein
MNTALRILAVDDDEDTRESLAMLLRLEGHQVLAAANGHQALDAALSESPDVVLLDISLPGLNGYEVSRRLKQRRPEKPPLVVAVSGYAENAALGDEAGIDLHLIKPVEPSELRRVLGRFGRLVGQAESQPLEPLTVRERNGSGTEINISDRANI